MLFNIFKNTALLFVIVMISCANLSNEKDKAKETEDLSFITKALKPNSKNDTMLKKALHNKQIVVGANLTKAYLPLLEGKRVGIVANQTSVIFKEIVASQTTQDSPYSHLIDSLKALKVDIKVVFAPEHGFRGNADAGELVKDGVDLKTNLPIISLYGKNKKPSPSQLKNLDIVIFDIQDVGARFYTYISSLHYVMEACAEQNIPVIVLDRPNPNGHYIDGPILERNIKSFVGMHPIPVVHGLTIGEYANMVNGENYLEHGVQCELHVIAMKNYNHHLSYSLPIKPSPNLPNDKSINLYPSLCFFEGTNVSAGRGTKTQFQIFGSPFLNADFFNFEFTPQPNHGAKYPKHKNKLCVGKNLTQTKNLNKINLNWIIEAYDKTDDKTTFFNPLFTKLAGTKKLQHQIESGLNESEIKATWKDGLEAFKKTRTKYLIYN